MVKHRTAITIISVTVIIGALCQGAQNIDKLSFLAQLNKVVAFSTDIAEAIRNDTLHILRFKSVCKAAIIFFCAGISVFVITYLKFPVSSTQALTGALVGWGLCCAEGEVFFTNLPYVAEFFLTWIINPVSAGLISYFLVTLYRKHCKGQTKHLKLWYILAGILASYSIGANSSAIPTAFFYDPYFEKTGVCANLFTDARLAALIGGISISIGVVTFSKGVMRTIGNDIARLNQSEGFIVIIAMALTVLLIEKSVGIPVSTSQTAVGAVVGAGIVSGKKNVNFTLIKRIAYAWLLSPVLSGVFAYIIASIFNQP